MEREAVKKGKQTVKRRNRAGMARHEVTSPHLKEVQVAEADVCTMELERNSTASCCAPDIMHGRNGVGGVPLHCHSEAVVHM